MHVDLELKKTIRALVAASVDRLLKQVVCGVAVKPRKPSKVAGRSTLNREVFDLHSFRMRMAQLPREQKKSYQKRLCRAIGATERRNR